MSIAQKLFEKGFITYHRTDSLNLSEKFINEARDFVTKEIGKEYLPKEPVHFKTNAKGAQEAHEAIRPTTLEIKPKGLTDDEYKIYSLIFKRAVESQMLPIEFLQTTIKIKSSNEYLFKTTGSIITFEGWLALTKKINISEDDDEINELPDLKIGDKLKLESLNPDQHFTQPPARFSDATLIKTLEEMQIGRPSTYAPTISTIQERGYVKKEGRYFVPDDVAFVVTDLLVKYFPEIVDYEFTANMEEKFDDIADGKTKWVPIISEFYKPFEKNVVARDKELHKADFTFLGMSEEMCPKCGKPLMVKLGKFGKFLSCSGYPDCEFAKPIDGEGVDPQGNPLEYEKCEKCGGSMVLKMGRFGKFLACSNYPKCKNIKKFVEKIGMKCPLCAEGDVIVKKFRGRTFYGCSRYPDCKYTSSKNPLDKSDETAESVDEN
jgi:DNA topoisomerase-1